jgi:hypothetical protein
MAGRKLVTSTLAEVSVLSFDAIRKPSSIVASTLLQGLCSVTIRITSETVSTFVDGGRCGDRLFRCA